MNEHIHKMDYDKLVLNYLQTCLNLGKLIGIIETLLLTYDINHREKIQKIIDECKFQNKESVK